MSNNKVKNQDSISQEDMETYLTYLLTGNVEDENHAKELRRLSRRTVNVSDVTVLLKAMTHKQDKSITQVMEALQIQQNVLEELGANDEMFKKAEERYTKDVEELRKQVEEYNKKKQEKTEGKDNGTEGE